MSISVLQLGNSFIIFRRKFKNLNNSAKVFLYHIVEFDHFRQKPPKNTRILSFLRESWTKNQVKGSLISQAFL